MVIELNEKYYNNFTQGVRVCEKIEESLRKGEEVLIKTGSNPITSTNFWNSTLGPLYEKFPRETLQEKIKFEGFDASAELSIASVLKLDRNQTRITPHII